MTNASNRSVHESSEKARKKLELTPLGRFVRLFTAATPVSFWTTLEHQVEDMADQDEDWEFAIYERIEGMRKFLELRSRYGESRNWPHDA